MFEDFNAKIVYTGKTAIFSHVIYATAAAAKSLQSCPTLRPHRQQPTRLPCAWGSPGKNTGVGCHSLQLAKCTPCSSLLYGDYQGDLPTSQ